MAADQIEKIRMQALADEISARLEAIDGSQGDEFARRLHLAGELLYVRGEEIVSALLLAAKSAPPLNRSETDGGRGEGS